MKENIYKYDPKEFTLEYLKNVFSEIFWEPFKRGEIVRCVKDGLYLTVGSLYVVRVGGGRTDVILQNDSGIAGKYPTSYFVSVLKP